MPYNYEYDGLAKYGTLPPKRVGGGGGGGGGGGVHGMNFHPKRSIKLSPNINERGWLKWEFSQILHKESKTYTKTPVWSLTNKNG